MAVQQLALKQADLVLDGFLTPDDMTDKIMNLTRQVLGDEDVP